MTTNFLEDSRGWDLADHSRPYHKFYCWGIEAEGKAVICSKLEDPGITWSRTLDSVQPSKALLKLLTRSILLKTLEPKFMCLHIFNNHRLRLCSFYNGRVKDEILVGIVMPLKLSVNSLSIRNFSSLLDHLEGGPEGLQRCFSWAVAGDQ